MGSPGPAAEEAVQARSGAIDGIVIERVAGDAGAKHFRAAIAGIGGERISRRFQQNRIDRLACRRIPAPDDIVRAAREQRAAVGQEYHRPDRQARTDQRAHERARLAVDHGDRATNARGGNQRAIRRNRNRNHRPWSCRNLTGRRTARGQEVDLAVGTADREFAVHAGSHGVECGRHRNDGRGLRVRQRPDANAEVVADADQGATIGRKRHAVDVLRMLIEHARRTACERPEPHRVIPRGRCERCAIGRCRSPRARRRVARPH